MIKSKIAVVIVIAALSQNLALARDAEEQLALPRGALAHAVEVMEQESGGKVLEIRPADQKDNPVFEAALARGDEVVYMRVAATDVVTAIEVTELPVWLTNYKMQVYMKSIPRAQVPLPEAILAAE